MLHNSLFCHQFYRWRNVHMIKWQIIRKNEAIFPTPQKSYVTIFLGCRLLYFGPTNTIHAKKYQKTTFGVLFGLPPKMHYSAPQCSAMYCSVNASIIHSRWVKYDPWWPMMTDYGPGWHTRGQGCTRGSRGAPGGARGVQATPGAKKSDKTVK